MLLSQLGIFGWKEADENLVLASLLTGDPLLLIGNHGCAKTHVANKVAQALGREFLVYDASKPCSRMCWAREIQLGPNSLAKPFIARDNRSDDPKVWADSKYPW